MEFDQNLLRELHDYNIPHVKLRFKFKSRNIDLTNIWKWYKHSPHWKHMD
jgi:hypothetical protein